MEGEERDSTQDWLLSAEATPPLLGELIERIEEALEVAQASEAAANAIGDAAIDAAEQARAAVRQSLRAAEQAHRSALLAEQASVAMLEARQRRPAFVPRPKLDEDRSLRNFSERADRVATRLRALERIPLRGPGQVDRRSGSDILPGAPG
jgi:hypothetical protein